MGMLKLRGAKIALAPDHIFVLAYSTICHFILALTVINFPVANDSDIPQQLIILTIASFILSLMSGLAQSRTTIAYSRIFRMTSIILTVALLKGSRADMEILFLLPLIVETVNKPLRLIEGIALALVLAFVSVFDFVLLIPNGVLGAIIHIAIIATIVFPVPILTVSLTRVSGRLADDREQIERLQTAIINLTNKNIAFQDYVEVSKTRSAEEERNRITRDLHDLVGHALTNIIMLMNATRIILPEVPGRLGEASEMVQQAKDQADSALQECRKILYELRATKLEGPTGLQALAALAKSFSETTHVDVTLSFGNISTSCGEWIDNVIYRIVQEGLTNAIKHGKADKIVVSLWNEGKNVNVSVRDNGVGAGEIVEGIGLKGMRERIAEFNGSLDIQGNTDSGFLLVASIPLEAAAKMGGDSYEPY
jgi:signal transduction histidine kinase